jgi:hypothetical protein
MQPEGGRKFVRLVKIEGLNHLLDVLPKLFPRITFGHDCLGQALSAIAAVVFLDHEQRKGTQAHLPQLRLVRARCCNNPLVPFW